MINFSTAAELFANAFPDLSIEWEQDDAGWTPKVSVPSENNYLSRKIFTPASREDIAWMLKPPYSAQLNLPNG